MDIVLARVIVLVGVP